MAEDCVKFIEKEAGKPAIQLLPKSSSVAPAKASDATSLSSLNSAAFNEATLATDPLSATATTTNVKGSFIVNNSSQAGGPSAAQQQQQQQVQNLPPTANNNW